MGQVDHGLDRSDPFGVGALFVSQSMAHKFNCETEVDALLFDLLAIETPQLPSEPPHEVLGPIDQLLNWIEREPALLELVRALLQLGAETPPRTDRAQRLYRAVLWTMMRHDPETTTPEILKVMRNSTPGARLRARTWPPHEFFASVLLLVYFGGSDARRELTDLVVAAGELGYHALAPILEWYLDHHQSAPPVRGT